MDFYEQANRIRGRKQILLYSMALKYSLLAIFKKYIGAEAIEHDRLCKDQFSL
jgi:hypothetical protein